MEALHPARQLEEKPGPGPRPIRDGPVITASHKNPSLLLRVHNRL